MSDTSRRPVSIFLWPFIALLTIGLPKPQTGHRAPAATTGQVEASAEPLSADCPAVGEAQLPAQMARAEISRPDPTWEKAAEFQLSARIAVNRQLNRPKRQIGSQGRRQSVVQSSGLFLSKTGGTSRNENFSNVMQTAEIIEFPMENVVKPARKAIAA